MVVVVVVSVAAEHDPSSTYESVSSANAVCESESYNLQLDPSALNENRTHSATAPHCAAHASTDTASTAAMKFARTPRVATRGPENLFKMHTFGIAVPTTNPGKSVVDAATVVDDAVVAVLGSAGVVAAVEVGTAAVELKNRSYSE